MPAPLRRTLVALALVVPLALGVGVPSALAATALHVHPGSGPAGTAIRLTGSGYRPTTCRVVFSFMDSSDAITVLGSRAVAADGSVHMKTTVPSGASSGKGTIFGNQARIMGGTCSRVVGRAAKAPFTVTATVSADGRSVR